MTKKEARILEARGISTKGMPITKNYLLFKKDSWKNISIHIVGDPENINTSDVDTIIRYYLDFGFMLVNLKTVYILKTGDKLSRKEYIQKKIK